MCTKLLIVCGPTATGKTALALGLAKKFNGELVSADSRQVYRGMDIGTGKDLPRNAKCQILNAKWHFRNKVYNVPKYHIDGVDVWMYDVVRPDEEFSVAHYQSLATYVIEDIRKRSKLPIVVGGTGFYFASLLSPIETSHIPPNKTLRKRLQQMSLVELQERLQKEYPSFWDAMNVSDRQNARRIIRKIEIAEYKRQEDAKTIRQKDNNTIRQEDVLMVGLTAPYPVLYKRIDERVEKRVRNGIVGEIAALLKKGYSWDLPSMSGLGYCEWKAYFDMSHVTCHMSQKDITQRWKWDEHGYARRQMAWFKKMKGICWIDISLAGWQEKVETTVRKWYTRNVRQQQPMRQLASN